MSEATTGAWMGAAADAPVAMLEAATGGLNGVGGRCTGGYVESSDNGHLILLHHWRFSLEFFLRLWRR
jgi:hypothetical protein